MNTDDEGRIVEFEEKPKNPKSNLASMGIYIFNWKVLRQALIEDHNNSESTNDFGHDIIPYLLNNDRDLFVYKFDGYWKDVGTVKSYWQANLDLIDPENPLNIQDDSWKIYTTALNLPPHRTGSKGILNDALINEGCIIDGEVNNSVLFSNVKIEEDACVNNCVILSGVTIKKGVRVYNSVITEDMEITKNIGDKNSTSVYLVSKDGIEEE